MSALANALKIPSLSLFRRSGIPVITQYWELEDMSGFFQLEDGTGNWLLEEA